MANILSVENLTHNWGDIQLLSNLNFGLNEGDKVALIARNGTGKTTLLNILAGRFSPDEGQVVFRGSILKGYLEQDPAFDDEHTVMESIFQSDNETAQLVRDYEEAVHKNDHETLQNLLSKMDRLGAWDYEERARQILSQLSITNFDQPVSELSGGQKKRVALANVLITNPDFLILDEPTNHLDLDMIEWLEDYLSRSRVTLLMVTHDRYFLDAVCNQIYELHQKTLYQYKGNYTYYLEKRAERMAQQTQEVERARNLMRKEQEWMNRMPQARGTKAKYRVDAFSDLKETAQQNLEEKSIQLDVQSSRLGKKVVNLHHISKKFDELNLINNFSYKFVRGDKIGVIGKNGTGKTTFLNILTGQLAPDTGKVEPGETLVFGYYRQQGLVFDDRKRVIEVITDIAHHIALGNNRSMTAAGFLRYFLFPNEMHNVLVEKLSGGEKKRLYLMTVLMKMPNFLILDEPTNDLDILTLNILEEYLINFNGCVLVVSHDRYFLDRVTDRLFVFEGDGVIKDFPGNYTDYNTHAKKRQQAQRNLAAETPKKPSPTKSTPKKEGPQKLSYKEKMEMKELEQKMEQLEAEKTRMENELNSGKLKPDDLVETSKQLSEIMKQLDRCEMRWLKLSEMEE